MATVQIHWFFFFFKSNNEIVPRMHNWVNGRSSMLFFLLCWRSELLGRHSQFASKLHLKQPQSRLRPGGGGAWQGSRGLSGTLVEDLMNFFFFRKDWSCNSLSLKVVVPKVSVTSVQPQNRNRSSCRLDFSSPGYTLVLRHLTAAIFDLVMPSVLMTWQIPRSSSSDHSADVAFLVVCPRS